MEAAALGLRARSRRLRLADVTHALNQERSIVRTWLMRGSLHLVAAEDVRPLLELLGPVFGAATQRRHRELGLTDAVKAKALSAIRSVLADSGPLTRYELVDRLHAFGIDLNPRSQAPIHLIAFAALQGICCLGPQRSPAEPTYVLLDDWVPAGKFDRSSSFEKLARRYFDAFGPATIEDFASWSGLAMTQARAAFLAASPGLQELRILGQAAYVTRGGFKSPPVHSSITVRLLPAFDTYLLGYRHRDLVTSKVLQRRLQRGGGWIHPSVVVDGRAIAAWSLQRTGRARIIVEPVSRLRAAVRAAIEEECADIGRFLDLRLGIEFGEPIAGPAPRRRQ